jgi:hypothetical protein
MPILLAGTIKFVHIEQVFALFKFRLGQVSLYLNSVTYIRTQYNIQKGRSSSLSGQFPKFYSARCHTKKPNIIKTK